MKRPSEPEGRLTSHSSSSAAQPASSSSAAQPASSTGPALPTSCSSAEQPPALDASILQSVERLGRYPRKTNKAKTDAEKAENALLSRIERTQHKLQAVTQERLQTLQEQRRAEVAVQAQQRREQSQKAKVLALVEELRAFGTWPRERARSNSSAAQPASCASGAQPAEVDSARPSPAQGKHVTQ